MASLAGLGRDLKLGFRHVCHSPGLTAIAVLSLALGIGANSAVFSLVNDVLLRSLPVKDPDRLVLLRNVQGPSGRMSRAGENNGSIDPATGRPSSTSFSLLAFESFRADHRGLSEVFAFAPFNQIHVLVDGVPETEILGQLVSGGYHAGLGVPMALGRPLTKDDDRLGAAPVAVVSWRYWQRRFGGDPSAIGKTVQVNLVPTVVVGVTERGFAGAMQVGESADITLPLALHARFQPDRGANRAQPWYWWVRVMGRLAPSATPAQVKAALEPTLQTTALEGWRLSQSLPLAQGAGQMPEPPTLAADPGGQGENDSRRQYRRSLAVLMGLVGLVLFAACANVATLLLARGAARRPEVAMRLALGASRGRVVRQLLAESLVLSGLAAVVGAALAFWGRGLLVALRQFSGSLVVLEPTIDARVLGFTTAVSAGTTLLFGLVPAIRTSGVALASEFQGGARPLGRRARSVGDRSLVVVQVALALVLLVGTGLFVRTLRNLQTVDPGFNTRALALFRIQAHTAGYASSQFAALHARIQQRLADLPGVRAATFSNVALLAGVRSNRRLTVAGSAPAGDAPAFNVNGLAPNFLEAMEIPLLLGRPFTDRDAAGAPRVAIVNEAFRRQVFGQENPIGRHLAFGTTPAGGGEDVEIIGVARDAKYTGLRQEAPATVYLAAAQQADGEANYCVRAAGDPAALFGAIRAAVREVDPTLAVTDLRTHDQQIARVSAQEILFARLCGFFGVVALALAAVGIYGLTSYLVVRRTGEFGVRMALGALPRQVWSLVVRESLALVAAGTFLGLAAAYGASGAVASTLFRVSPVDSFTYAGAPAILVAVAVLASLVPARRATRVSPAVALRSQ
jgi:predicted permease